MKIENSVVLVSGANRGLGLAFVEELRARGARKVYAGARQPGPAQSPDVVPVRLDVTDPQSIAAAARELRDVTFLVNNAGISRGGGAVPADGLARARQEMETNYFGPLALAAAFAPVLQANGGGAILNVLSVLSWVSSARTTTYGASKAAAWALTNGLRAELAGQGTQVVGLHVGYIDTDMARGFPGAKVSPQSVVRAALDGVERGQLEVLADEPSRAVQGGLSAGVYLQAL